MRSPPTGRRDGHRPIAGQLPLRREHLDAIDQSHERCAALGVSRIERPDHTPVGRSSLAQLRERNRRLYDHAAPVMEMLHEQIVQSQSMVVLTDATGVILHSIGDDDFLERAAKVALQPGAVWSETAKGTNAIGTALVEEAPTLVHADEHYVHANHFLTCSAAPILDPRGNMLGVLDVSGDHRGYHQHTMALVKMSARMIENGWLADDHRNVMRLHFHGRVDFIGTLMEGIVAVAPDGRIVGANRGALEQLGLSGAALRMHSLGSLFGTTVDALVDRFRSPLATPAPVHAPGGRAFHLLARFNWPVWTSLAEALTVNRRAPANEPPPPSAPRPAGGALAALRSGDAQVDAVIARLQKVLDRDIPILVRGDTGTGKALLARALHADSQRAALPFVVLPCASATPALLDAELLRCGGGTLVLDEVADLAPGLQAQLLRTLAQQSIAVIGTTRRDLRELTAAGAFREDLFYRLDGLTVRLPALRERSDLTALAQRLLAEQNPGRTPTLAPDVQALFAAHRWPGNVRELFNVLRAASVLAAGEPVITRAHLPDDFADAARAAAPAAPPAAAARRLDDIETDAIRRAVDAAHGNISAASKQLGISRNTVYRKLRWKTPSR